MARARTSTGMKGWGSFVTKGGGTCHRQDKRRKTGSSRTAKQRAASTRRRK